jgi:hypothetical protein
MMPESARSEGGAHLIDERWGVAHALRRDCTQIGRDATNTIIVRDMAASRFHAEVRREGDAHVLHALGSTETRLNGRPATAPCALAEGDVIEIVYTKLRFTAAPLPRDVTMAPEQVAVDRTLAEGKTQFREIVSTKRLRRLRRPVRTPLWIVVLIIVVGGALLGVLIQLVLG